MFFLFLSEHGRGLKEKQRGQEDGFRLWKNGTEAYALSSEQMCGQTI